VKGIILAGGTGSRRHRLMGMPNTHALHAQSLQEGTLALDHSGPLPDRVDRSWTGQCEGLASSAGWHCAPRGRTTCDHGPVYS